MFHRGTSGDTARPPCGDPPTPEMMTCTKSPCLYTYGGMIPAASNYWPRERRRFLRPNPFLRPTISQHTHTTSPSANPSSGPRRILYVCPHPEDKEGWSMRIVSSSTMSPIVSPALAQSTVPLSSSAPVEGCQSPPLSVPMPLVWPHMLTEAQCDTAC